MKTLKETLSRIEPQSAEWRKKAEDHIARLTMPPWALGRVLDTAVDLCGIGRTVSPDVRRKRVMLFAGDHGVVEEGVSNSPKAVTMEMIRNFVRGGAAVNVLAETMGAEVVVVDAGVDGDLAPEVASGSVIDGKIARGTRNFTRGPAMTREQAVASLELGIRMAERFADGTDVFATGEMGIGNTTPSSAIIAVFAGMGNDPLPLVGRGTMIPESNLPKKAAVIRRGIERNQPDPADPVDVLGKVGGLEIGAIAGLILGAAALRKPVLVDGFISTAGALIAGKLAPVSREYMIPAHGSVERGHGAMLRELGLKPLLDLNLRLGEGTGAVLAMPILDAASAVMRKMATFESAGVSTGV